uniref:Uncharacterized protein n=1 Tax=Romanomermis culicivorax TaxID=13658 RepID=A0A915HH27_ROMCU
MRKEHEILLEKMRDEHKSEKLRIEKDFEEKLIEFKNERQKVEQKKKDEYLLDNGKLINETMLKLRKENDAKLADLKQKLDQNFELEYQKLVVDQEERMSKLKQDLNRQFEEYKLKLKHETDAMKAEESQKVGSRIRQESSSSKAEKSCQVTIENDNTPKMSPDPENHFLDQSLADLHLELEGMRRDLRDLTGVVRELKKVDMPAPMVKKDVRHVEKHANKPKNKKKQKFIRSLDEFLTSCDEEQIKHDPILEKLETEDTIKRARQFINNQNFQPNTSRMNNFPQYSWKFEKKDNVDEMINARLRQVFPESNTFSSLFVPMHDRGENSPIRKSNVEMELESLKNWLKKFEKEIK